MQQIIDLLQISKRCFLDKKITKTAIGTHAELNATEKKILKNIISEIVWIASYKPTNSNIPVFINDKESYDEIQIISVTFKDDKYTNQIINLIQKTMPYPIVLLLFTDERFMMTTADKFINQTDKTKRTIEKISKTDWINIKEKTGINTTFLEHLNTNAFSTTNLKSFYGHFTGLINQYKSALLTGSYSSSNKLHVKNDANIIEQIEIFDKEVISLKSRIKKETVFSEKVTLNMVLKKIEEKRINFINKLS